MFWRVLLAVLLGTAAVIALWLAWAFYSVPIAHWALGTIFVPAQAGPWGDSFGPFSAFFSALGFAAVAATLLLQGLTLQQQQDDMHKQRFEATYFELLDMLRIARSEVRYKQSSPYRSAKGYSRIAKIETGPDAFRTAMFEFRYWLETQPIPADAKSAKIYLGELYKKRVHRRYESTFGPYFRLIYTILWRLRDDKKLTSEEKRRYGNLLRGHLTSFEVGLAGFNGLMDQAKDFDTLISEFRLLKYYPNGFVRRTLEAVYPSQAFRGRSKTESRDDILENDPLDANDELSADAEKSGT